LAIRGVNRDSKGPGWSFTGAAHIARQPCFDFDEVFRMKVAFVFDGQLTSNGSPFESRPSATSCIRSCPTSGLIILAYVRFGVVDTSRSPTYCLLEDDSLITGLEIQTQRLLARPNDVHLLIEVDARVANPRGYNQMFLGD
jgi:hypothetical protein